VSRLDRDLRQLCAANLLYGLGIGLYLQLLFVYAMDLGASRATIGVLNAVLLVCVAAGNLPGAWASQHFRLKTVIVVIWWLPVAAAVCFALAPSWQWLVPGLVLSGLCMANNPAFKSYIALRSEPGRVARNITLVFGAYPAGLVVAPLAGGFIADHYGMHAVFWLSAVFYAASSVAATFIRHVPSEAHQTPLRHAAIRDNRGFHRYVVFFLVGFLAVYVGQAFLTPYLSVAHDQGYSALGIYASLTALGAAVLTPLSGRVADLRGPRAGAALVLALMCAGTLLLLAGASPIGWAAAMFLCGGYDAFRFLATGVVSRSFGDIPLAWGFALFDTTMGLPMAGGALLGGVLFQASPSLPFVFTAAVSLILLVVLVTAPRAVAYDSPRTGTR